MEPNASKHERIHALDSLRAILMMLGLVLHSALTYGEIDYTPGWSLHDSNATNVLMDWLSMVIHVFRMPLFFVVAGFFGAMLFYKRGARKMIINRLERILYPFMVFIFLLWPSIAFSFTYTKAVFAGAENPMQIATSIFDSIIILLPGSTFHLWFLYYLLMITLGSFLIGLLIKKLPKISRNIIPVFDPIIRYPFLKLFVFSALTFLLLKLMGANWASTSTGYIPDFNTLIFYSFFYLFGWILFKSKQPLKQLTDFDWLFTVLGIALFTTKFIFTNTLGDGVIIAFNSLAVWSLSFGITGLFIRYGSHHSEIMRYISDSSYWFYLIHLPLTAILPGLIAGWNMPGIIKFMIVLTITITICAITYHYLVRATFIGKFLNGRRYPRSIRGNKPVVKMERAA